MLDYDLYLAVLRLFPCLVEYDHLDLNAAERLLAPWKFNDLNLVERVLADLRDGRAS